MYLTRYDQYDSKLFVEDLTEKIFLVKSVGKIKASKLVVNSSNESLSYLGPIC